MTQKSQDPLSQIENALVILRRDQQRRRLQRGGERQFGTIGEQSVEGRGGHSAERQRRAEAGGFRDRRHGHRDGSLGGAARFRMLDALATTPGLSVTEIAEAIGVDQPRASRLVNESVDTGLLHRTPDPHDGRRSVVELSASGRSALETAQSSRRAAVTEATAGFTAEEVEVFAGLLARFVEAWPRE